MRRTKFTMTTTKTTKEVIKGMLQENTGASFLDSGGAYGRNYERNQARDFESEPACLVEAYNHSDGDSEVSVSFNLYHYLNAYLEYAPRLQASFERFCKRTDPNNDKSYMTLMEDFASHGKHKSQGTTNTYNYDNLLSQTIQYTMFSLDGNEYDAYILLQIHGGCDVRGGYTAPKLFKVCERDYFLMAQNDAYARAGKYELQSDDGGYHWYYEGSSRNEIPLAFKVIDGKPFAEIEEPVKEDPTTMLFDKAQFGKPPTETKLIPVEFMVSDSY